MNDGHISLRVYSVCEIVGPKIRRRVIAHHTQVLT
jgi:hypothetical protein